MKQWTLSHNGLQLKVWQSTNNSNRGMIVISHGAGGSLLDHRGTASHLVQSGWTVCAPLHAGDNFRDKSKLGSDAYWFDRPKEVSLAIDAMLTHPRTQSLIDPNRICAIGFSAGGYSVLAAAGGQPDLGKLKLHCADSTRDKKFCSFGAKEIGSNQTQIIESLKRDDRIKAIALIAPVGAIFAAGTLDNVRCKTLLIQAGSDQVLAAPFHAANIHKLMKIEHQYLTIDDLHHYGFIEPFPWFLRPFFEAAKDPKGYRRKKNLTELNARITQFLNDSIKN